MVVVVVVVCFAVGFLFPWWCVLAHQRCACHGGHHRWEAAQRVSLSLTALQQQATPTGTERRSPQTRAMPTLILWCIHLDVVSYWIRSIRYTMLILITVFLITLNEFWVNIGTIMLVMQCYSCWQLSSLFACSLAGSCPLSCNLWGPGGLGRCHRLLQHIGLWGGGSACPTGESSFTTLARKGGKRNVCV